MVATIGTESTTGVMKRPRRILTKPAGVMPKLAAVVDAGTDVDISNAVVDASRANRNKFNFFMNDIARACNDKAPGGSG